MAIYLFEPKELRSRFYPLTKTRAVAELLLGGLSVLQWWRMLLGEQVSLLTADYLHPRTSLSAGDILIFSGWVPDSKWVDAVKNGTLLYAEYESEQPRQQLISCTLTRSIEIEALMLWLEGRDTDMEQRLIQEVTRNEQPRLQVELATLLDAPSKLLALQGDFIKQLAGRINQNECPYFERELQHNTEKTVKANLVLARGVMLEQAFLNTDNGPIVMGEGVLVMAGAMLRGPLYLGPRTVVKMGTRIYGPLVAEADCTLGGELKNVVLHKGTNKAHDGYLGDSIIGAWCNFGAGSGGSNVKNTAGKVGLYDYSAKRYLKVGPKFGAVVGDYTRIGVGTQLTTGTSIGVCCNLFGLEMLPKLVTDFAWGSGTNWDVYQLEKAIAHIRAWMGFKAVQLSDREIQILNHIFEQTDHRS